MPTLEKLTQADLNRVMNAKSLRKAQGYVDLVQRAVRSGSSLTAQVSGNRLYEVDIDVGPDGIRGRCNCSRAWGRFCEHIGAVLLKWIEAPGAFSVKEPAPKPAGFLLPVTPVEPMPTYRPKNLPFWLASSAATRRQAGQQQLAGWLEAITLQDLRSMAKNRGWSIKGNKKAEIIQQIVAQMTNAVDILKASQGLDAEHQQVFRAMLLLGDEPGLKVEDLERVAAGWGTLKAYEQVSTYTYHLHQSGLVFLGHIIASYPPRIDFVPQAIARQLPPPLAGLIPASTDPSSDQPASELALADPVALVRTAHQLMLLLEQSPTPLRPPMPRPQIEKFYPGLADWDYDPQEVLLAKERGKLQGYSDLSLVVPPPAWSLPNEAIERLAPIAGGKARLEFIFSLLVAAGLFQPGSPVTAWPEVKEQFLRYNEPMQRALLSRVYFNMHNWSELWEVLRAENQLQLRRSWMFSIMKPEVLWTDLVRFRQLALRVLACLPDNQWLKLDDLYPLMKRVWPRFDHSVWQYTAYYGPTGQRAGWFLARRNTEKALSPPDEADWKIAQGNFIRQMITGPLYWLGLVDLLFKDGAPVEMRLHGLADLYWDRVEALTGSGYALTEAAEAPPPAEAIKINEYTIQVNPAAISAQAHSLFDKIARLDEVSPDRFTYTLSALAVHASFEAGDTLTDILADWERLLAIPLPEAIAARLHEWWQAYGQVRIYENVTVIEFGDDYALAEMKAVTSLEKHLIAEISPRLIMIPQVAVEPLAAELEKAGYMPKQTDGV